MALRPQSAWGIGLTTASLFTRRKKALPVNIEGGQILYITHIGWGVSTRENPATSNARFVASLSWTPDLLFLSNAAEDSGFLADFEVSWARSGSDTFLTEAVYRELWTFPEPIPIAAPSLSLYAAAVNVDVPMTVIATVRYYVDRVSRQDAAWLARQQRSNEAFA